MRRAKYIVTESAGIEAAIVFSDMVSHADVAGGIGGKILGAGFVQFYEDDGDVLAQTYGRSDSMNLAPRGEDAALLEKDILC